MAQWARQYSGNTHGTRVEDAEIKLREAIASFRGVTVADVQAKRFAAVRRAANRVLQARLRFFKARIAAGRTSPTAALTKSHEKQRVALAAGVSGILREFGVTE